MNATAPSETPIRSEREGAIAVLVIDNPPVNAGSLAVRRGIVEAIDAIAKDPGALGVVIIGAGRSFISGSDIREFGGPLEDPQLPAVIAAIQDLAKPVVAAIHGAALGGGYEMALGCDARIAAQDAVVGLPEVTLGIIPGAGGTQRLPRLTGVATAIELIASGRRVPAPEALRLGMIDAIAGENLRDEAVAMAHGLAGTKRRLDRQPVPSGDAAEIEAARQKALARSRGGSALKYALESIGNAQTLPVDQALVRERAIFQQLRTGEEAAALRYLFFAEREAARVPDGTPSDLAITKVGIVGAGTMGSAIAVAFADAGYDVTMVEKDPAALAAGLDRIAATYKRAVTSGRLTQDAADVILRRIVSSAAITDLADHDLAIEAVFEDMAVKKSVMTALDGVLKPSAFLASNTSYLDLNELAEATGRPRQVIGLHFFSPANVMRLLEVVEGSQTAPQTLAAAFAVARRLRKVVVLSRVGEGFIGNRIYNAYRTQCEYLLEEGAYPQDVDAALETFGFAMGPFAVGDLSGLDIAWRTRQRLAPGRNPRVRYVDILDRLCEAGHFGRKTGAGWYRYVDGSPKKIPDSQTNALIDEASKRKGISRRAIGQGEIVERALGAIVNEAALILSEGIARRPSDIDLALVHGYGFPAWRGGPLFWASRRTQQDISRIVDQVAQATGFGFRRGNVEAMLEAFSREARGPSSPAPSPPHPAARE